MPAIITHHLFGEDAAALIPEGVIVGSEGLLAFLLGNQGPDPLRVRFRGAPWQVRACRQLFDRMHAARMTDAFFALRTSVTHLRDDDKEVGRAFVLGMAAHYLLDSMANPLFLAQAAELAQADPSLTAARDEVLSLMKAEVDSWTLWQKRQQTVVDSPATGSLACTKRIERVAGALMSQTAWEVFGLEVGAAEYAGAVRDYRLLYRLVDPPATPASQLLERTERLPCPHARLLAQAHPIISSDACPSANLAHNRWHNPATGETSTASLPDLFHDALIAWPCFAQRLVEGDRERLDAMIGGINYDGAPAK